MKRITIPCLAISVVMVLCLSQLSACQSWPLKWLDHSHDIPYTTAFVSPSAPDGYATPYTISFYREGGSDGIEAKNVSPEEVSQFAGRQKQLPRTDHFNTFLPEKLHALLPILDYAMYNGYSKMCIPTIEFTDGMVFAASKYLKMIYHVNDTGITARTVYSFVNEDGDTVNYIYVSIMGLSIADASCYREAIDEARRIVDTVPKDYSEYETAVYLYRYLTDNVTYFDGDYYGDSEWNLLYDALIQKSTVCAGYSEALYVLYNLAGIECFSVYGYIYYNPEENDEGTESYNGSHIWNIAKLGDTYYEFDPTWDAGSLVSDYLFFADSTEDLCSYYPRQVAAFTQEYCTARSVSLFDKVDLDDNTVDYYLLSVACTIHNYAHANPLKLLDLFGYPTEQRTLDQTQDGWLVTPVSYRSLYEKLCSYLSAELADDFLNGYIRDEKGRVAFRSDLSCGETYRFCGMEDGQAHICTFDERGNFARSKTVYHIGIVAGRYVLDKLEITVD